MSGATNFPSFPDPPFGIANPRKYPLQYPGEG